MRTQDGQLPIEQWSVCLPEHHPGYVSWDDYLQTRERLRANVILPGEGGGPPREGDALLQGLLRCGRCGRRMQVAYSGNSGRIVRYPACAPINSMAPATPASQSAAQRLEKAVTAAFLDAVTPAGLRVSADAIEELNAATRRAHARTATRRRARRVSKPTARAASSTRASPSTDSSRAPSRARLERALGDLERERRRLAELEQRRPSRSRPTSAAR